jgi:hypothetical protein
MVYLADCVELMRLMPPECVDVVFADPPYRLSGGGVTVKSGRVTSVDKGKWERSLGFGKDRVGSAKCYVVTLFARRGASRRISSSTCIVREARPVFNADGTL